MEQQKGAKRCNKANQRQHRNHEKAYKAYRLLKKHERSHIRRIEKHLAKYGRNDKQALGALERYRGLMKQGFSSRRDTITIGLGAYGNPSSDKQPQTLRY